MCTRYPLHAHTRGLWSSRDSHSHGWESGAPKACHQRIWLAYHYQAAPPAEVQPWGSMDPYWAPTLAGGVGQCKGVGVVVTNSSTNISRTVALIVEGPPMQRLHLKTVAIHVHGFFYALKI